MYQSKHFPQYALFCFVFLFLFCFVLFVFYRNIDKIKFVWSEKGISFQVWCQFELGHVPCCSQDVHKLILSMGWYCQNLSQTWFEFHHLEWTQIGFQISFYCSCHSTELVGHMYCVLGEMGEMWSLWTKSRKARIDYGWSNWISLIFDDVQWLGDSRIPGSRILSISVVLPQYCHFSIFLAWLGYFCCLCKVLYMSNLHGFSAFQIGKSQTNFGLEISPFLSKSFVDPITGK